MKQTQGKWKVESGPTKYLIFGGGWPVAKTYAKRDIDLVNANLIISAPELLKLAKMERDKHLFGEAKFFIKYGVNWNDIKGVRKMLIAKAEGGAK